MFNMVRAELFRLSRKKSNYVFFLVIAAAYILLVFLIKMNSLTNGNLYSPHNMLSIGKQCLTYLPIVFVVQAFNSVYLDDITANKFGETLGSGKRSGEYIFSKLISSIIYIFIGLVFLGLVFFTQFAISSKGFAGDISSYGFVFKNMFYMAGVVLMGTAVYSLFGMIIALLSRRTTLSLILIVIFSIQVPTQIFSLLSMKIKIFKPVAKYTWDNIAFLPLKDLEFSNIFWTGIICYFVIFLVGNILLLNKRDLKI